MKSNFDYVKELEIELASQNTRVNPKRLSELLHNQFEESGKSGKIYNKADIISELSTWKYFEAKLTDFKYFELSNSCVLLKYKSSINGVNVNRSSIWLKEDKRW